MSADRDLVERMAEAIIADGYNPATAADIARAALAVAKPDLAALRADRDEAIAGMSRWARAAGAAEAERHVLRARVEALEGAAASLLNATAAIHPDLDLDYEQKMTIARAEGNLRAALEAKP